MMHTTIRRSLAGAALLTTMLTACGTSSATPSPVIATRSIAPVSPVPVSSTSQTSASAPPPASSGTPSASVSAGGYDPALVAEAEKVFREYQAAFIKWQQKGGSATLPPEFDRWSMPPIETDLKKVLAEQSREGWRLTGSSPRVTTQGALPNLSMNGSTISILGCVDSSHSTILNANGTRQAGVVIQYRAYFAGGAGSLRLVNEQNRQVEKC